MSLSPEVQARLDEADKNQEHYRANEEQRRGLGEISLYSTIGITLAGKTTVAANAERIASDKIHPVLTTTTRPAKPGEPLDAMHFVPHDNEHLADMLDQIDHGELAQYVVHPTGYIYATYLHDYRPDAHNIMPTLSSTVDYLSTIGFGSYRQIVVTPDINAWQRNFAHANYNPRETVKRLEEAVQSLTWSLDNKDKVQWLWNREGEQQATAQRFLDMLADSSLSDADAIAVASRLLDSAITPMLRRAKEGYRG